jgi:hypothetical protein
MLPQNVAANCAPRPVHRQGRRARRGRADIHTLQV